MQTIIAHVGKGKTMKVDFRKELEEQVKTMGQEVIDRAADLVGTGDLLVDFGITLNFPADGVPTLTVTKEYAGHRDIERRFKK